jgi:hypothetical protein
MKTNNLSLLRRVRARKWVIRKEFTASCLVVFMTLTGKKVGTFGFPISKTAHLSAQNGEGWRCSLTSSHTR